MRVLVTGGSGFIGKYVVRELKSRGHSPVVLDRSHESTEEDVILCDVRDFVGVVEAMAHVDAYIHLAGVLGTQETIVNPIPAMHTNVLGGVHVLQAGAQYDLPGVVIAVGNHWMLNPYSISKSTVERLAAMYRQDRQQRVSVVRAFNAYGPDQSIAEPFGPSKVRKIMPAFICRALTGQPIEVYGDGGQVMDMIHVADVAEILVEVLQDTAHVAPFPKPVEAGTGVRTTVLDIAQVVQLEVQKQAGTTSPIVHLPMRPGETLGSVVLANDPFPGQRITLEMGVESTVRWLRSEWLPTWTG